MANDELNQLIKVAREAAFFIRSIDGYENSKIANELSSLAEKVERQKLLAIGRLAARVVYRNAKKAVEHSVQATGLRRCPACNALLEDHSVYCDTCGTDTPRA
jgi:hypothetical protein